MGISMTETAIIFENRYVKIAISQKDSAVESIFDKVHGKELKGEDAYFFSLVAQDKQTLVAPTALRCNDDCITVVTPLGNFQVAVTAEEEYITFALVSALPADSYKCIFAHAKYSYDVSDKRNAGAVGIAMTYWTNPCFYPDAKDRQTRAEALTGLRHEGAKYGLIIAPITEHKQIIKKVCRTIDKNKGIVSEYSGPWAQDVKANCGNYMLELDSELTYIQNRIPMYKKLGLDQVDIHQWPTTFRQGDFKYTYYDSPAEFKEKVVDLLRRNGLGASLHTYACYIDYACAPILSDPKWQKDLGVLETVTLAADIDEAADFLPTVESTEGISNQDGFLSPNTPFLLIGEELIRFETGTNGFPVAQRGVCGTKAVPHAKGEQIKHIKGLFEMIAPVMGSDLFFQIARDTAKAYNEGGYEMIYVDALDGIYFSCDRDDDLTSFYVAAFVCEILKWCDTTPIFECSIRRPSLWLARARIGNFDTPHRGYRNWNKWHLSKNKDFMDMYMQPSLGWYWFYPSKDKYPGNSNTKYQHTDVVEYMGALAAMYNFNMVYVNMEAGQNEGCSAIDRNIAIYRRCDELRKANYFSEETLQKVRTGRWEYHIVPKADGSFVFMEKDYQFKKLYDLCDAARNQGRFNNPFAAQKPFLRIEALMSAREKGQQVLLALDKNKELTEQVLECSFDGSIDLSSRLAKKVSICGNGKAGSAIAIKMRAGITSSKSYGEYIIDTDFEGWRDFVLLETDNGERTDLSFKNETDIYSIYRYDFDHEHVTKIVVETTGDTTGVKMSDIVAVDHMYEVLKNPTVRVGDSAVTFHCELMSTDYIEFDGTNAKVIDRYGNEKPVYFTGALEVPAGSFAAELTAKPLNGGVARAQLTLGFTGQEIE